MSLDASKHPPSPAAPLHRRLAWVTGVRLALCAVLLGLLGSLHLRDLSRAPTFTVQTALGTLAVAFALTAAYAAGLRGNRNLQRQVSMQLTVDPALWTVIVYLSGGPASGATSLYGLSCVTGALLTGFRGSMTALSASLGCFGALVLGSTIGLLPPPPDQPPDVYQMSGAELVYTSVVNVLAMIVVALLAGSLAERLRVTGGQLVEARERAEQAERMAALGRVAAGLAHEIRNPLGAISGSIQLLRSNPALADEDLRLCNIISREANRLSDLVSDMMNLAKPRRPDLTSTNVASIAREVVDLAREWGRSASDVKVTYQGPERALVIADASQLKQLTWNLVRNAVQASHAGGVVEVTVETDANQRPRGRLMVSDEGVGLDEQARARIFDAFFTTRAQGTGVGLAVVKRIADDHGFTIDVRSESGKGARFVVDLGPLVELPPGTRVPREEKRTLFPTGP